MESAGFALGSCAGCFNRPVRSDDENEEAASSNRARHEARGMSSAAAAARTAHEDCTRLGSNNAAHRCSCAIRLAVRLVRGPAPKGAKMFKASDVTSKSEGQSSRSVPSRTAGLLQRASRSAPISKTTPDHQRRRAVPKTGGETPNHEGACSCGKGELKSPHALFLFRLH